MREYTGMSLRGLLWTGPAGYALNVLGMGWHYSLVGSWMGLVYYLGGKTPDWDIAYAERNLNGQIQWSELYWGWWIWFVLKLTCVSYTIKVVRKRLRTKRIRNEALDMIQYLWSGCYETMMFIINIIFACSVGFYPLVEQKDIRNKGQTFFGLLTGVLFLTFVQAFNWGWWWNRYHSRRKLVRSGSVATINTSIENNVPNETTALLPWPQSHPNAPQGHLEQSDLPSNGVINNLSDGRRFKFAHVWNGLETVFHLDTFIIIRWFLGALSALHTILVLIMFTLCIIMDIHSPRLMPFYRIVNDTASTDDYDNYYY